MSAASTLATRAKHAVQNRLAQRYHLRGEIDRMDAVGDPTAIARALGTQEFPWGITQALSFALFRTYAVPSIGDLLYKTSQFTESTQKRYDDTGLLLERPLVCGFDSADGRAASGEKCAVASVAARPEFCMPTSKASARRARSSRRPTLPAR